MVVGAFPIAKLGVLAVRQVSKPLANKIKERAKKSHFFRTYICMPPAQFYHWMEVTVKMKLLNLGKPSEVTKLNETMAIELGAELLGETIIFTFAALTLTAEYIRQSRKESHKEAEQENRLMKLEESFNGVRNIVEQQNATITELANGLNELKKKSIIGKLIEEGKRQITGIDNSEGNSAPSKNVTPIVPENQILLNNAISYVNNYFGVKPLAATDKISVETVTYAGGPSCTCQVCSKFGIHYSLQNVSPRKAFHLKRKASKYDLINEALDDVLAIVTGSSRSIKYSPKLSKTWTHSTYPRKQSHSFLQQSIMNASEYVIGKKDTRKMEFDSLFLTAADFAEDASDNILNDFSIVEIADEASNILFGEASRPLPDFSSRFSPLPRENRVDDKYKKFKVKYEPGIFEQGLEDAVDYILEGR